DVEEALARPIKAGHERRHQPRQREAAVQPEHRHLAAVRVSRELQLDAELLRPQPGVRLVREQDRRGAFRATFERGRQVEAAVPRVVDAAQPEAVAAPLEQYAAVPKYADSGPFQLALDGVRPRPEVVVAEAGEGAVARRDRSDRLRRLARERRRVVDDVA